MNWIICPLRNGLHLTRKALPTFLAQDIGDVRVWFIDNGSTDGTREWLWSLTDPRVEVTIFSSPKSVAATWNYGLSHLFGNGTEYACVINNDVELRPDTLRHLVADGGPFVTATGVREREKIEPPYAAPDPAHKRPHPDYSCFLIRRECYETVGPFDEGYEVAFFEDNDHHLRLHRAGITAVSLELPFYHVGSATVKNADEKERERITSAAGRNKERFYQKWGVYSGTKEYYDLFGSTAPEAAVEG